MLDVVAKEPAVIRVRADHTVSDGHLQKHLEIPNYLDIPGQTLPNNGRSVPASLKFHKANDEGGVDLQASL